MSVNNTAKSVAWEDEMSWATRNSNMQSLTSSSHDLVTLISQETGSLLKTEAVVS